MRYALILHNEEVRREDVPAESWADAEAGFERFVRELTDAGVLADAAILHPSTAASIVKVREGKMRVQDGPFADTKEKLAGIFSIDVPDIDAAMAWAEKCPGAAYGTIEIRPAQLVVSEGVWQPAG
ncbi:YciI family protein [Paramicrobacterium chengjingii]|uniref:YciI family protein n=1 Tax=Paramicrobacterium chengjingii TaxID=2769067 RepID=A0ABX6YGI3_9MICO|nr:YciI family protein [Microbacterium chengjingii]QPZ37904.1 YciI family protein [Microbacterium chengjingii]